MAAIQPGKANPSRKSELGGMGPTFLKSVICVILISALALSLFVVDVRLHSSNLMAWINKNPSQGFFVFVVLYTIGTGKWASAIPIANPFA